jgi:ABC-2 type transport system permease protein
MIVRYELRRTFRNGRFVFLSIVPPLVLFYVIALSTRTARISGTPGPLYFMSSMAAYGSMIAVVSGAARIVADQAVGWIRQLQTMPVPIGSYFVAKVLGGYLLAVLSLAALYASGLGVGVHLKASQWLTMTGLLLVGLMPFALLSIVLGHLLTVDSASPVLGFGTSLLALLGGAFFPFANSGSVQRVVELIPSYWLVQAGRSAEHGGGWPAEGWLVMAGWSCVLVGCAALAYRRHSA